MDESRSAAASVKQGEDVDPLLGRFINDRYKVVSVIARGGMGKVYRAEQAPLGRQVALKVLMPNYEGEKDPGFHRRFFLEASIASKLTHPNTVTIFDYGKTDDEVFYIAMELLEGRTLQRALRDEGPFDAERTMRIARQICRSLREAHSLDVIHRDLKPANVFLVKQEEGEFVKVLDFGLVKDLGDSQENLTKTGLFMGSPKYMSPEQIRSDKVDARADIYALGVMMYEMLSGKVPFDRANSVNILMAHIHEQVPTIGQINPSVRVSPQLESVVHRCMAKRPEDRYASMNDVLSALKVVSGRSPQETLTGQHAAVSREGRITVTSGQTRIDATYEVGDDDFSGSGANSGPKRPSATTTTVSNAPVFARAAKPGNSAAPLFLAALFALTGIGGFIVLTQPFEKAEDEALIVGSKPQEAKPAPEPEKEPEPVYAANKRLVLSLKSTPTGAMVSVTTPNGVTKEYGPTPAHVVWTGEDAADGNEVTFKFRKRGFQEMTVTQTVQGDRLQVDPPPLEPLARRSKATTGDAVKPSE